MDLVISGFFFFEDEHGMEKITHVFFFCQKTYFFLFVLIWFIND